MIRPTLGQLVLYYSDDGKLIGAAPVVETNGYSFLCKTLMGLKRFSYLTGHGLNCGGYVRLFDARSGAAAVFYEGPTSRAA